MRNSMTVLILSLGLFTGSAFSESGFSDDAMDLAIPVDVLATQTGRENLQDDVSWRQSLVTTSWFPEARDRMLFRVTRFRMPEASRLLFRTPGIKSSSRVQ